ncbi:F-box/kelch-repeat protein At1g74510-like [Silene latifolia]|uniref:F-box/kelch-repeat protein At1g74510-like n=1 Tax=Silene latifolia TaxID=37657 RepID=UPI003D78637C
MVEGPSFHLFLDFRRVCDQERNLMYNGLDSPETSKFKRKPEDGENLGNSLKLLKIDKTDEMEVDFLSLSLSLIVHQPYKNNNDSNSNNYGDGCNDHLDTTSLINQIGRDNSINCIAHCSRSDYGSIASLNRNFRSLTQSKELYKFRRKMGMVEHWVYISCSLLEWEVFDPIRCRWKHLPRMPSTNCFMHSDKESLAVGTELLVFGKGIDSHLIYKYSLLTNSWSHGPEMNTPRCLFGSSTLGEIAICAGGCDVWGNVFSSAELYNSESGTWKVLPNMNKARKKCSAVFMDGKFYVLGGFGVANSNPYTCGEVFDLERRTWTEIPDMLPITTGASAMSEAPPLLTVVNNELYAANYARKEVRKYNKRSNTWITVGSLPESAVSMQGWGLAFRGCGDRLTVIGGPRGLDGGFIEVNVWDPSQTPQQWTVLDRKRSGGFVYNCAVMGC